MKLPEIRWAKSSTFNKDGIELSTLRKHKPDYWLPAICLILAIIGVVVVYSIGPALQQTTGISSTYLTSRQLLAVGLSIIAFFMASRLPVSFYKNYYKLFIGFALLVTFAAVIIPVNPAYPAHRWVRLGGLSFQSVEVVKYVVVVVTAMFLTRAMRLGIVNDNRKVMIPFAVALVTMGILIAYIQSDLGSMGVIVAIMGSMAFMAGLNLKKVAVIGAVILVGLVLAIIVFPYRRARIEAYIHPQSNCHSAANFQACQALIAVGSGGFLGSGLGKSVSAYGYEPEADNDSIFAIYAQTFGFVGCIIMIGLFTVLFTRMKNIAVGAPDNLTRLIVIGILAWLSFQTIINIGAMVGVLPLKGITLPFVSYGGTSVVFSAAAMGLVYQISSYSDFRVVKTESLNGSKYDESGPDRRRIRGAYHPNTGGRD